MYVSGHDNEDRRIRTQHYVTQNLIVIHLDMTNGNAQAQNFLELELDRRSNFRNFVA